MNWRFAVIGLLPFVSAAYQRSFSTCLDTPLIASWRNTNHLYCIVAGAVASNLRLASAGYMMIASAPASQPGEQWPCDIFMGAHFSYFGGVQQAKHLRECLPR